jgi:hypothetical protein
MCLFVLLREISSFFGKSFSFLFSLFVINILFVLPPPPQESIMQAAEEKVYEKKWQGLGWNK